MKKLMALLLILLLAAAAQAEKIELTGRIEYPATIVVYAGTGGTAGSICVSAGQKIAAGDLIADVAVTRVFMPWDGEIRTVNVKAGEKISSSEAVLYEFRERYLLKASMDYAYSDATEPVKPGEHLHLACATDASHVGWGIAVNVSGSNFDILTTAGSFYPGEVVNVYRGEEANARMKAGAATVYKADAQSIAADGCVTRVFASEGERILKGEALFDIAEGAQTDRILSDASGIVSGVLISEGTALTENTPVLRLLDESSACIAVYGTEAELMGISEGCTAAVTFLCDRTETVYRAVVTDVTYAQNADGQYRAELKLNSNPAFLREGLGANIIIELD